MSKDNNNNTSSAGVGSGGDRARQSHSYSRSASITGGRNPTSTAEPGSPFGDDSQINLGSSFQRPSQGRGSTSGFSSSPEEDISPRTTSTTSGGDRFEAAAPIPLTSPFADDMPSSNQAKQTGKGARGSSSSSGRPSGRGSGSSSSGNKNGMTTSNSQFFDEHYSPTQGTSPVMQASLSPPIQEGEYSPTQELESYPTETGAATVQSPVDDVPPNSNSDANNHLYAPRPNYGRMTSDEPLLHDVSGANTPLDGLNHNPFDSNNNIRDPSPASPHSSRGTSPDLEAIGPNALAPKIHINSIPNSPNPDYVASFDPRPSFAAPFSDQPPSSINRGSQPQVISKKVSIAENPISNRYSDGSSSSGSGEGSGGLAGAAAGGAAGLTSIAQRRSQRMQTQQQRMSAMPGKKGGNGDGKGGKGAGPGTNRKPFQSTRLKGEIYKPWLDKKDPAQRWARWITIVSIIIGIGAAAALCYDGYAAVPKLGKTCLRLEDNFDTLNLDNWEREVRLDGYDNGEFQWTTNSDNNSFVEDGVLYLTPTLTSDHLGEDAISNGYTLNLTQDGTCTSTNVSQCVAVSNTSKLTVINPVMSARLITKKTVSIKYGKVEVRAKFPTGDWLWPSIFMLPVEETYGKFPRSGEIDLVTGRGNNQSYPTRGFDYAQSSLHWGPTSELDRLWMTWGYREQRRTYYNQEYHTYGLEWNEEYLWTYIDSRVAQVISLRFKESFWTKGKFPSTLTNTTTGEVQRLTNPWIASENNVAPFDQKFYLILNLAVGATNGWFPDGEGGKPWIDSSGTAMTDFWAAKDRWWNQWPSDRKERGFAIDSVKMWEVC